MPPEDEDEFWEWFENLSPEEQQFFQYQDQFQQANTLPFDFGGPMAPSLDMGSFGLGTFNGGASIPEYTSKGALDPYDLTQAAKRYNLMQDYATGSVDNALAMFAGPGAYGPNAFADKVTPPSKQANDSGRRMAEQYAQGGGYEEFIAQKLLEGNTPSAAYADLMALIETEPDENTPPEAVAAREELIRSLPKARQDGPVMPGQEVEPFDAESIMGFGTELFQGLFQDDRPNYVDPQTGIGYLDAPQTERSEAAQWYDQRGLPLPTESYDSPEYLQAMRDAYGWDQEAAPIEERQREAAAQLRAAEQAVRDNTARGDEYEEAYKAVLPEQDFRAWANLTQDKAMEGNLASTWQPDRDTGSNIGGFGPAPVVREPSLGGFIGGNPAAAMNSQWQNSPRVNANAMTNGQASAMRNTRTGDVVPNPNVRDPQFDFGKYLAAGPREEITADTVRKTRAKTPELQAQRRKAWAADRDAKYYSSQQSQDAAYALGQQMARAKQGRTPLQDALLQRLLGQSAMGGR